MTTKRGQSGTPRSSYNGVGGVQVLTNRVQLADARQYAEIFNERNAAAGYPASTSLPPNLKNELLPTPFSQVQLSGGRLTQSPGQ